MNRGGSSSMGGMNRGGSSSMGGMNRGGGMGGSMGGGNNRSRVMFRFQSSGAVAGDAVQAQAMQRQVFRLGLRGQRSIR
jgi:hypothetical protein